MKKREDLKQLEKEDLIQKQKMYKKELFELNQQKKIGQVEKPARFKAIRKEIARILTVIKERELKNG